MKTILTSLIALSIVAIQPLVGENNHIPLSIEHNQPKAHGHFHSEEWRAYGTFVLDPYANSDNPKCNLLGLDGEVSLPYTVPEGYQLVIDYLQIEGPDGPQVGMALWLGDHPCTNEKSIISCTTPGGSTQLFGMSIPINGGQIVNIRIMNNTHIPWCNGFYLEGQLRRIY